MGNGEWGDGERGGWGEGGMGRKNNYPFGVRGCASSLLTERTGSPITNYLFAFSQCPMPNYQLPTTNN
ncbi:hypothetical protein [Tolypothrix sp. VBCCA 56010]|uniref:hypothetical protein n=1 Tax=Tolypothrix sp. VBCCA 56010 TaxID=3137731 RepID=UPI003D7CA2E4